MVSGGFGAPVSPFTFALHLNRPQDFSLPFLNSQMVTFFVLPQSQRTKK
jgi:hypothetical protein